MRLKVKLNSKEKGLEKLKQKLTRKKRKLTKKQSVVVKQLDKPNLNG